MLGEILVFVFCLAWDRWVQETWMPRSGKLPQQFIAEVFWKSGF